MTRVRRPVRLKHEHISGILAREIRSGRLGRGSRLPGEVALAERFNVSRTTVRAALAELSESGLIATRTGKGSFVLYDGHPLDAGQGWAHALASQGVAVSTRVLSVTRRRDDDLATRLGLPTAEVVLVERVREITPDHPISYERSTLPAAGRLGDLPERGLDGSLTGELERAGLRGHHGAQTVRMRRLDEHEARVLQRSPGDWYLETCRTTLAADGSLVEQVDSLLDPEHFELALTFGGET